MLWNSCKILVGDIQQFWSSNWTWNWHGCAVFVKIISLALIAAKPSSLLTVFGIHHRLEIVSPIMTQTLGMTAILCCDMLWKLCHFMAGATKSNLHSKWETTYCVPLKSHGYPEIRFIFLLSKLYPESCECENVKLCNELWSRHI